MRKAISLLLTACILCALAAVPASAAESTPQFAYQFLLYRSGSLVEDSTDLREGDTVRLDVVLTRTDIADNAAYYVWYFDFPTLAQNMTSSDQKGGGYYNTAAPYQYLGYQCNFSYQDLQSGASGGKQMQKSEVIGSCTYTVGKGGTAGIRMLGAAVVKVKGDSTAYYPTTKGTVRIDVNGGNAVSKTEYAADIGTVISLPTVARTGYRFAGWDDGSGTVITGTSYTVRGGAVTLKAVWTCTHTAGTWQSNDTTHWKVCGNCHEEIAGTGAAHSFGSGSVCSVCGYTKSSGTGGGGGGAAVTAPQKTVPIIGGREQTALGVSVSDGIAAVESVKAAELSLVTRTLKSGAVKLDLTGLETDIRGALIPGGLLSAVGAAAAGLAGDAAALQISLSDAAVAFDVTALKSVLAQSGGQNIQLNVDAVNPSALNSAQKSAIAGLNVGAVYEISLTCGGKRISDLGGGFAEIVPSRKLPGGTANASAWYLAENGALAKMTASVSGGIIRFFIPHFSAYLVTYDSRGAAYESCTGDASCPIWRFSDTVPTVWYHDGIHYCLDEGLMVGVSDTAFAPNGTTSRAMVVSILYRMEGSPAVTDGSAFTDVTAGQWYCDAIRWASANSVVSGYDNGRFGPDDPITREQLATILYRYAASKGGGGETGVSLTRFADGGKVSDWAVAALQWAVGVGLVSGRDTGSGILLAPQDRATRAEAASIIMRFCTGRLF